MFFVIICQCYEKQIKQHTHNSIFAPSQPDVTGLPNPSRQAGIIISLWIGFLIKALKTSPPIKFFIPS